MINSVTTKHSSGLHMIIMDELDAICKQRGSTNSGTGVHDTVVNQLLSKIDGVEQLNNILIIGMTNRFTFHNGLCLFFIFLTVKYKYISSKMLSLSKENCSTTTKNKICTNVH